MNPPRSSWCVRVSNQENLQLRGWGWEELAHVSDFSITGYQAPDKIDSKFFDPKYAFKEVEVQTKSVSELVSKKKPKV